MKKSFLFLPIFALIVPASVFAATLQNTDSQSYELQIQETGRPYGEQYRIIENAKVEFCFLGCRVTMLSTGQSVRVNPNDAVVIDSGVMSVTAAD